MSFLLFVKIRQKEECLNDKTILGCGFTKIRFHIKSQLCSGVKIIMTLYIAPALICPCLTFHLRYVDCSLFSWAPKPLQMVTAAIKLKDAYSWEDKTMTNLDNILKSRDVTLLTKVHLIKAMVFPVVMYGCESLL